MNSHLMQLLSGNSSFILMRHNNAARQHELFNIAERLTKWPVKAGPDKEIHASTVQGLIIILTSLFFNAAKSKSKTFSLEKLLNN